jgi:ABC-type sugar transport system ATPase subunit
MQGIALNEQQRKAIATNQPLTLGIRPEHIQPADLQDAHLCGFVQLVEALGSETNLSIAIDDLSVNAKVSADLTYTIGEKSGWCLDTSKLYLFDRASGNVLLHAY